MRRGDTIMPVPSSPFPSPSGSTTCSRCSRLLHQAASSCVLGNVDVGKQVAEMLGTEAGNCHGETKRKDGASYVFGIADIAQCHYRHTSKHLSTWLGAAART
jgi:hypothetical protein